jgi:hypothetical protein
MKKVQLGMRDKYIDYNKKRFNMNLLEDFMKNLGSKVVLVLLIGLFISCASGVHMPTTANPYRPLKEFPNANVVGSVQNTFESQYWYKRSNEIPRITESAYMSLLEAAKKEYSGNIDIVDISWIFVRDRFSTNYYTANGKVVTLDGSNPRNTAAGVEAALERAAEQTVQNVPRRSTIAIVYITAQDRSTIDYITGELEYIWVNAGYTITDRSQLDRLRQEQNLQLSGEVDDATAVSIGKFAGADIIVTGRVDGEGDLRRLRLRALDTQTAQVVGVASERL